MMTRILPFALSLSAIALAACSGSVIVGTGGSGGDETTTGTGVTGTATGTTTTGTGTGGSCTRTTDSFAFTLKKDKQSLDCSGVQPGQSGVYQFNASVISSTGTSLVLDTCPPNADCAGPFADFAVDSPGFSFDIPVGAFVQVDVRIDFPWGCSQTILVRNLPTWGGLPSPGGTLPTMYFAGSNGAVNPIDGTPFAIGNTPLGCDGTNQGCGIADDYRFDVTGANGTQSVYQGQTALVTISDSGTQREIEFRNLRSFETGWCDDYWNWAWWASSNVFYPD